MHSLDLRIVGLMARRASRWYPDVDADDLRGVAYLAAVEASYRPMKDSRRFGGYVRRAVMCAMMQYAFRQRYGVCYRTNLKGTPPPMMMPQADDVDADTCCSHVVLKSDSEAEESTELTMILRKLTPPSRMFVRMHYIDGHTTQDARRASGVSRRQAELIMREMRKVAGVAT